VNEDRDNRNNDTNDEGSGIQICSPADLEINCHSSMQCVCGDNMPVLVFVMKPNKFAETGERDI